MVFANQQRDTDSRLYTCNSVIVMGMGVEMVMRMVAYIAGPNIIPMFRNADTILMVWVL